MELTHRGSERQSPPETAFPFAEPTAPAGVARLDSAAGAARMLSGPAEPPRLAPGAAWSETPGEDALERERADKERLARIQSRVRPIVFPLVALALFLLAWEAFSHRAGVMLPGPAATIRDSWQYIAHPFFDNGANDKGLGWQILASLRRVAIGYGLAALLGVSLGFLLGRFRGLYQALDPLMQVLRTIPPLAWLPLSLAIFNQAEPSAIWVILVTAIWPIVINTSVGVLRLPRDYEQVAQVYGIRGWRYVRLVVAPAAAPYVFTGLRVAIGMAWLAIVASEMLTGGVGIGFFIWDSWNSSRIGDIVVAIVYVGLVGLALDRAVALAGRMLGTTTD